MKKLSLIFVFFTTLSLKAQVVPGFMGKKTIVSYTFGFSPAINGPTIFNKVSIFGVEEKPFTETSLFLIPFNVSHSVSIERVIKRKFSLALNYKFYKTKEFVDFIDNFNTDFYGSRFYYSNVELRMSGHLTNLSFVFYRKNAIAPYGKYFKFNLGVLTTVSKFLETKIKEDNNGSNEFGVPYYLYLGEGKIVKNFAAIGFAFGSNRIYKKKFVVGRGINFSLPISSDYSYSKNNEQAAYQTYAKQTYQKIFRKNFGHESISIYLSFGYLF
jgi:hypothetical protein